MSGTRLRGHSCAECAKAHGAMASAWRRGPSERVPRVSAAGVPRGRCIAAGGAGSDFTALGHCRARPGAGQARGAAAGEPGKSGPCAGSGVRLRLQERGRPRQAAGGAQHPSRRARAPASPAPRAASRGSGSATRGLAAFLHR